MLGIINMGLFAQLNTSIVIMKNRNRIVFPKGFPHSLRVFPQEGMHLAREDLSADVEEHSIISVQKVSGGRNWLWAGTMDRLQ